MDRSAGATERNGSGLVTAAPAPADKKKSLAALPLFRKASEVLGAQIWHVDDDFNPTTAPRPVPKVVQDQDAGADPVTDTDEG